MKPLRRVTALLLCLLLCLTPAAAAEELDVHRACTLTLTYTQEGIAFPDLSLRLYRVAEANPDGTFERVAPFDRYPVTIHDLTTPEAWSTAASTLSAYAAADSLPVIATAVTNGSGTAVVTELPTGLYLVAGVTATAERGTYLFDDFMVYLPTLQEGAYCYDLSVKPKCSHFDPAPQPTEYSVRKLWRDSGTKTHRPAAVTVDLLKDGAVVDTVTLSAANNWCHRWTAADGRWSVAERQTAAGYTVALTRRDTAFVLTNTYNPPDDPDNPDTPDKPDDPDTPDQPTEPTKPEPPETGDTAPVLLYLLGLCLSGLALLMLGVAALRGNRHETR